MASGPISYRDFSRNGPLDPTPLCVTAWVIGINLNRKCLWEGFGGKTISGRAPLTNRCFFHCFVHTLLLRNLFKMYIKQVVIDGFKSYATRTTISGFDPQFNAITGLNGSGKSNILDSICFLLGISNLTQVNVNFLPYTLVVEDYKNYGNLRF